MVEQMVNSKLSKYGLGNSGSIVTTSDKQPSVDFDKTTLRYMRNDQITASASLSVRETKPTEDGTHVPGDKVPMPDTLLTARLQSTGSSNMNQQLVYARRKSDAELNNCGHLDKNRNSTSEYPESERFTNGTSVSQPHSKIKESKSENRSAFAATPPNFTVTSCGTLLPASLEKHNYQPLAGTNSVVSWSEYPQMIGNHHSGDRFMQLQKYLKHCNYTKHEAYVQMVQSFTLDERSRLVVELEKRSIHLLLEEGREMQRMKVLNVLGKSAPNNYPSPHTPKVKLEE